MLCLSPAFADRQGMKLGAPSIERFLLDGWETTKASRRPSGFPTSILVFFREHPAKFARRQQMSDEGLLTRDDVGPK
jgi:hypothetical protein